MKAAYERWDHTREVDAEELLGFRPERMLPQQQNPLLARPNPAAKGTIERQGLVRPTGERRGAPSGGLSGKRKSEETVEVWGGGERREGGAKMATSGESGLITVSHGGVGSENEGDCESPSVPPRGEEGRRGREEGGRDRAIGGEVMRGAICRSHTLVITYHDVDHTSVTEGQFLECFLPL